MINESRSMDMLLNAGRTTGQRLCNQIHLTLNQNKENDPRSITSFSSSMKMDEARLQRKWMKGSLVGAGWRIVLADRWVLLNFWHSKPSINVMVRVEYIIHLWFSHIKIVIAQSILWSPLVTMSFLKPNDILITSPKLWVHNNDTLRIGCLGQVVNAGGGCPLRLIDTCKYYVDFLTMPTCFNCFPILSQGKDQYHHFFFFWHVITFSDKSPDRAWQQSRLVHSISTSHVWH